MSEKFERARQWLSGRAGAYRRVFRGTGFDGERVLSDLASFCRAHKSTAHTDPYMAARLDGRREAWLRIQQHLNLTDEELWQLFDGRR